MFKYYVIITYTKSKISITKTKITDIKDIENIVWKSILLSQKRLKNYKGWLTSM